VSNKRGFGSISSLEQDKISGLEPFKFNFNNLVSTLQSRCGCSVTTHHVKEKNSEKTEVTVHGIFLDEVEDYLKDECKIDEKYLNSTNKIAMKKKEKTFGI